MPSTKAENLFGVNSQVDAVPKSTQDGLRYGGRVVSGGSTQRPPKSDYKAATTANAPDNRPPAQPSSDNPNPNDPKADPGNRPNPASQPNTPLPPAGGTTSTSLRFDPRSFHSYIDALRYLKSLVSTEFAKIPSSLLSLPNSYASYVQKSYELKDQKISALVSNMLRDSLGKAAPQAAQVFFLGHDFVQSAKNYFDQDPHSSALPYNDYLKPGYILKDDKQLRQYNSSVTGFRKLIQDIPEAISTQQGSVQNPFSVGGAYLPPLNQIIEQTSLDMQVTENLGNQNQGTNSAYEEQHSNIDPVWLAFYFAFKILGLSVDDFYLRLILNTYRWFRGKDTLLNALVQSFPTIPGAVLMRAKM